MSKPASDINDSNFTCAGLLLHTTGIGLSHKALTTWFFSAFMVVITPAYFWYCVAKEEKHLVKTKCYIRKSITTYLCLIVCIAEIMTVVVSVIEDGLRWEPNIGMTSVKAAMLFFAVKFTLLEQKKEHVTPMFLSAFWGLILATHIMPVFTSQFLKDHHDNHISFPTAATYVVIAILQWMIRYSMQSSEPAQQDKPDKNECPEVRASLISRIFLQWIDGLLLTGYKKPLKAEDMFDLRPSEMSRTVVPIFEANWNKMKKEWQDGNQETPEKSSKTQNPPKSQQAPKPSLLRVLVKTFGWQLLLAQLYYLSFKILDYVLPHFMEQLIEFAQGKDGHTQKDPWRGYWLVAMFFIVSFIKAIVINQFWQYNLAVGIRIKASLASAIYKKLLMICNLARKESTVGEIINLMSVDLEEVRHLFHFLFAIWSTPFQICVALYFLYHTVGDAVFSGLLVLVCLVPINAVFFRNLKTLGDQRKNEKDNRIKLLTEVLNGIKILKLYAWEMAFKEKILAIRHRELSLRKKVILIRTLLTFTLHLSPYFVSLATFATYIFMSDEHHLDATTAFVAAYWFEALRFVIFRAPGFYTDFLRARMAMERLEAFLNKEDIDVRNVMHESTEEDAIKIKDGTFLWDPELGNCLKNINMAVEEGSLVAIVGPVGAGKSSVLSALMGEMVKVEGQVNVKGTVAYVPQQAWLQHSSMQDNILFGKPLETKRYQEVIDACGLRSDIEILPAGDATEVGEKGINLSGGQKQRISLARAVYHGTDIYFLDDPLSAVDAHVGKHIFENVIGNTGLLKGKTRVLVTHGVQWLPKVDKIIVLDNGCVSEMGTYDQLLSHDGAFAKFLQTYMKQDIEDMSESDDEKKQILQRLTSITSEGDPEEVDRKHDPEEKEAVGLRRRIPRSAPVKEEKVEKKPTVDDSKFVEDEKYETGNVKFSVYMTYARAIGFGFFIIAVVCFSLHQLSSVAINTWLSLWADDNILNDPSIPRNSSEIRDRNKYYLGVYTMFGVMQACFVLINGYVFLTRSSAACKVLHENLLHNILRSPMSFFDVTPVGRIVHRFTKDIEILDGHIAYIAEIFLHCLCGLIGSISVILYTSPWFLVVFVPLGSIYLFIRQFFIPTSRQLKRLETHSKSPIFSHFGETIAGASVIRAFSAQERFSDESQKLLDTNQKYLYGIWSTDRWLSIRLESLGVCVIASTAFIAITDQSLIQGGIIGLCLTYALRFTGRLHEFVRLSTQLETSAISMEKIKEYTESPTEAELSIPDHMPTENWPHRGTVRIKNYSTRYRAGQDLVLKNIDARIKPGEKVGIVGRTGAGKSSLTLALFRLIEPTDGSIHVDDENIGHLGLHDCRSNLTILPQDPVLFSGTLRMNLDPMDVHTDETIWEALEHAHLRQYIETLPGKLEYDCGEGGDNMSVGQRQLLCLARSLLRKTKVLVLDEATAAVDLETDDLIQATIRTEFKDSTVLTIAHRLHTVIDYDRIMVLDKGEIKEFDSPQALLQRPDGLFYQLAKDAKLV